MIFRGHPDIQALRDRIGNREKLRRLERRPAPVFFMPAGALLAGVVEQSLRHVLPKRVATIQSDCIGLLDFHGPLAASAGDTQDMALNFGKPQGPIAVRAVNTSAQVLLRGKAFRPVMDNMLTKEDRVRGRFVIGAREWVPDLLTDILDEERTSPRLLNNSGTGDGVRRSRKDHRLARAQFQSLLAARMEPIA